ncbi:hypothetical protein PG995_007762 [Apiospora arundinis]
MAQHDQETSVMIIKPDPLHKLGGQAISLASVFQDTLRMGGYVNTERPLHRRLRVWHLSGADKHPKHSFQPSMLYLYVKNLSSEHLSLVDHIEYVGVGQHDAHEDANLIRMRPTETPFWNVLASSPIRGQEGLSWAFVPSSAFNRVQQGLLVLPRA